MTAGQRCPLCSSTETEGFLSRDAVPVQQNVLFDTPAAAREARRGDLRMTVCRLCGFVFNAAFDPGRMSYARGYDNDQTFSAYFDRYVESLVGKLREEVGIEDKTIAEIGCGTGYFLRRVVAAGSGSVGVGYDPSYAGEPSTADGRVAFVASAFTSNGRPADLIICRHVIEHIPDPRAFVAGIRGNITDGAAIVFETPAVEWILRNGVIWDLFYEHCSLFSAASLARLLEGCGFRVQTVGEVFNGQYLWTTARADRWRTGPPSSDATTVVADCRRFATAEREMLARWDEVIRRAARRGGVAVWGAGAKGATFVSLVDPDAAVISCLVDVNPRKQGRYVAGTGHPVVSPAALNGSKISTVLIMNPNYETEIRSAAHSAGVRPDFVIP